MSLTLVFKSIRNIVLTGKQTRSRIDIELEESEKYLDRGYT